VQVNRIQFDGAAIPNPGQMGIGVVLIQDNLIIREISRKLPDVGTNNIAEYVALNIGIQAALELDWKHVIIEGDSKLVINQLNGIWRVRQNHLKKLHSEVSKNLANFESFSIKWIPREQNSRADVLASKALGHMEDPYHFRFGKRMHREI
jgi:ribonuclease HI